MLMSYGPAIFTVAKLNMHESNAERGHAFARKDVIGRRPPIESVGESEATYSLSGRVFPYKLGGFWQLYALELWSTSGIAAPLIRGDGMFLGWYAIEKFSVGDSYLSKKGLGQMIEFEISFVKDDAPAASDFFASFF